VLPVNQVLYGNCVKVMRSFPAESIDMVMFSPPYWGLRDYGLQTQTIWGGDPKCKHKWGSEIVTKTRGTVHGPNANVGNVLSGISGTEIDQGNFCVKCGAWRGQLGLEPDHGMYVAHMVEVCGEVKRVLKKTGSMYIVLGDTYAGSHCGKGDKTLFQNYRRLKVEGNLYDKPSPQAQSNLPPKCLMGIPWRVALALIDDSWILRNCLVWHKPNHMPSSVKDRFSNTYEFIFFFTKSRKYYFDLDAVRERPKSFDFIRKVWKGKNPGDVVSHSPETRTLGAILGIKGAVKIPGGKGWVGHPPGGMARIVRERDPRWLPPKGKNPRDFWSVKTKPFPGAHFAVYPEEICVRPIKSSCPRGGIVLDPMCGSGTTLGVALRLGRRYIGIDINPDYVKMAKARLASVFLTNVAK